MHACPSKIGIRKRYKKFVLSSSDLEISQSRTYKVSHLTIILQRSLTNFNTEWKASDFAEMLDKLSRKFQLWMNSTKRSSL